jgi:hypothetical protein
MDERLNSEKTVSNGEQSVRFIVGSMLLIVASTLTYWLIISLSNLWDAPSEIGMVQFFERLSTDASVLVLPTGTVEFPQTWTVIIGVFFCVLLMSIVATLVTTLFREALHILFPQRNVINKND